MTRQQQNEIILNKMAGQLTDSPNVQMQLDTMFNGWFRNLVKQGISAMQPQQAAASGAPQASQGQEAAPPSAPQGAE